MTATVLVRLLSSHSAGLQNGRKMGKYVTILAGISACGGAVAYREWLKLKKAVHFKPDTSLSDQDARSYIYLQSDSSDDLVTQVKKTVHWNLSTLEHFLEDRGIAWLPLDTSRDDPWRLLRRTQSDNKHERLVAISALANKHHWDDSEYRAVAQACNQRTLIGLARSHDVDLRFFLPPPQLQESKESLQDALCALVGGLPRSNIDKCTEFFTSKAFREGHHALAADHQSGALVFGGTHLSFVTGLSKRPQESQELNYLLALLSHSEVASHCTTIVDRGGLQVLMKCYLERSNSMTIQCHIAHIIANMSIHQKLHDSILQAGWITVLAKWMKSNITPLASHAARALANLDRESCQEKYEDGVYLLHPQTRNRTPYEADVVFVHGLMGGAFHTWRQKDPEKKKKNDLLKNSSSSKNPPANPSADNSGTIINKTESISASQSADAGLCTKCNSNNISGQIEEAGLNREPISTSVGVRNGKDGRVTSAKQQCENELQLSIVSPESLQQGYTDCWPKSWLSEDCPHMRIITVSYESHITEWAVKCPYESEKRSLASRSAELLRKLHLAGVGKRPIIWVTHSMGGLLVKQMLVDACYKPELENLIDNTHGIVFFSTPHHGASLAALSQQAQFLLYPTVEVKDLTQDAPYLKNIHGMFRAFVQTYQIPVLSFGEKLPTNIGLAIKTYLVPKMSSHPGFGEYHTLDVNHLDICKPADRNSLLYVILVRFITQNVSRALHKSLAERLTRDLSLDETEDIFYPLGISFGE